MDFYKLNVLDVGLIAMILFFSAGYVFSFHFSPSLQCAKETKAIVYQNGKAVNHLTLAGHQEIALLKGKVLIETMPGRIRISRSDCPRRICVKGGWIKRPGQILTCVPNKVLIEICAEEPSFIDAVVR